MPRLVTVAGSNATAAPLRANIINAPSLGIGVRLSKDGLLALPAGSYPNFLRIENKSNLRAAMSVDPDATQANMFLVWSGGNVFASGGVINLPAVLASVTGDVVIRWEWRAGTTARFGIWEAGSTTALVDRLSSGTVSALPDATDTSNGVQVGSTAAGPSDFDAVWVYVPGTQPWTGEQPTSALSFYGFPLASGTTTPDAVAGGPDLTVGNATLIAGGQWDGLATPPASGSRASALYYSLV